MNWKLARELRWRGLSATSVMEEGLANQQIKDGRLIKMLATPEYEPCVLVAWDNKMPRAHRSDLEHFGLTLAVIDRYADRGGLNDEEYYRDVIHRHAHPIAAQEQGSVWKYTRARGTRLRLG